MTNLNENGQRVVARLSRDHGFSEDATRHMLDALASGRSSQAQFNHPEFGGMGQWAQGGMTMIGDMFNNGLKARVDALCQDLARELSGGTLFRTAPHGADGVSYSASQSGSGGWPEELGQPASQGAQNDMRYAYFPQTRRLAIAHGGRMTVYDTGEHQISGFGQAQGGEQTLSFTSQSGLVPVSSLRTVDAPEEKSEGTPRAEPSHAVSAGAVPSSVVTGLSDDQIFARLEKLGDLRDRGIISDADFDRKKSELLDRL